ncbi:MAG: FMN-binding protein [Lachnospiraceae bacterium]|nr:FMN-binding protein [Lachnospiraceae bacterium]
MILIQSLVLAGVLVRLGKNVLKKHPVVCYGVASMISLAVVWIVWSGVETGDTWFLPAFLQGGLAGSLFIIVMFAGAVPNGSPYMRYIMPIRGELSIIASILTLGHNIAFGKTYFLSLFSRTAMAANVKLAAICSLVMILIMLPLFLTSFRCIRRKMKGKSWKRLQRLAYLFYGLMYIHVLLLNLPAVPLRVSAKINVFLYSMVFFVYADMRIGKYLKKRGKCSRIKYLHFFFGIFFLLVCAGVVRSEARPVELSDAVSYMDGVYSGSGMGYNGPLRVEVTIENGELTDIQVQSSVDDAPYFQKAVNHTIPAVLEQQSPEVDITSGATYSSAGLKAAIRDALAAARQEDFES